MPPSGLNTYTTNATSLVRWVSMPVYKSSNTRKQVPDAVLIAGDLANGKTATLERVISILESGYAGLYARDTQGNYTLLASVFRATSTSDVLVDLDPISDAHLDKVYNSGGETHLQWEKFQGRGAS